MRNHLFVVATILLAACGSGRPDLPSTTLGPGKDTVSLAQENVTGAAWLGGDRWATLAPADNAVTVVDFASKKGTPLNLTAKKELANPFAVFGSHDSLFVADWGKRRVSVWTPEGRLLGAIPASDALRGALPRERDREGHFYAQLNPSPGPDGSGNRDSAAVVRTTADLSRADTVARLAPLDIAEVSGENGHRFERRIFSGEDRWGLLDDGRLWVARVYQHRVDLRSPDGKWRRGKPLPDRVLEVTRYDRELFVRGFPKELRPTAEQLPFAPVKPPFEQAFSDGAQIWLERSRAPADSARSYLVVDSTGALLREVRLPGRGRLIAAHGSTLVAAEPAPDGTHLVRYTAP
jgi:hypothetical protein